MISALMLQGTGSDVGKSVLCAGLCRALKNRGVNVHPFKPQNMSNNAAVTVDGGEIGRAQALQARACRLPLHTDMNPVLLKPQSETGAQVIVEGKVAGSATAEEYQAMKPGLLNSVLESFERVSVKSEIVVIEGAGSAAEVNLRKNDIANMGFAEAARVPVVLVGDIDRGGVIAQLVGTWVLLTEAERALTRGFIVNKFRGEASLFDSGRAVIKEETGIFDYGLVPWFDGAASLPREDAFQINTDAPDYEKIKIVVPTLSRIANFDDFDPLRAEPDVSVVMVKAGSALPGDADLIVVPGSKATIADIRFLKDQGWDIDIAAHVRRGGKVMGICGGYQMLGRKVSDPEGIEGPPGEEQGLGLLDVETVLSPEKRLAQITGRDLLTNTNITGFEMHMGVTSGYDTQRPMLELNSGVHGATSVNGMVSGAYVHGLFASDNFRLSFLRSLSPEVRSGIQYEARIDAELDRLATHLETNIDIDAMLAG